jgi:hypothetical protein
VPQPPAEAQPGRAGLRTDRAPRHGRLRQGALAAAGSRSAGRDLLSPGSVVTHNAST